MKREIVELIRDPRLTPDALRVALYVFTLGPGVHEIDHDVISSLLEEAGPKRIRKAKRRGERLGLISIRPGGRGHSDTFEFLIPTDRHAPGEHLTNSGGEFRGALGGRLSDSRAAGETLNADSSAPEGTLMGPPSPPPSSSSPSGARTREEMALQELREYLGEHGDCLDRLAQKVGSASWAADVWDSFGPRGVNRRVFNGLDPEQVVAALVTAINDYAGQQAIFKAKLFRGFVESAVRDERSRDATIRSLRKTTEADRVRARLRPDEGAAARKRARHRLNPGSGGLRPIGELVAQFGVIGRLDTSSEPTDEVGIEEGRLEIELARRAVDDPELSAAAENVTREMEMYYAEDGQFAANLTDEQRDHVMVTFGVKRLRALTKGRSKRLLDAARREESVTA